MRKEGKRLKDVRKSLALTQAVFAEGLGLKQGPYSMIESGKVGLSSDVLKKLIGTYRINPVWLFDGQGPMTIDASEVAVEEEIATKMVPLSSVQEHSHKDGITLSRLTEIRKATTFASSAEKDQFIEELITACMVLKEENSDQKGEIIKLMSNLQNLVGSLS